MTIAHLVWALLILFLYRSHAFVFFLLKKTKNKNHWIDWNVISDAENLQFPLVRTETVSKCQQVFIIISIPFKVQLLKTSTLSKKLAVGQNSYWIVCTKQYPSDCYSSYIYTTYSPYTQSLWADSIDSMAPQAQVNGQWMYIIRRKK